MKSIRLKLGGEMMKRRGLNIGIATLVGCAGIAGTAIASEGPDGASRHDGPTGEHLRIGYYYGHDSTFEAPAVPAWPATLLVDTHPWQLGSEVFNMEPVSNILLNGWELTIPGFERLPADEQELDGHGFFSWAAPDYPYNPVQILLHIVEADPRLQILTPFTLQPLPTVSVLGSNFHSHPVFFVDESEDIAPGELLMVTFFVSDANGSLADSEPFTLRFSIQPAGCNPADLNSASATNPGSPDWGVPDGVLTASDFTAFAAFFAAGDLRADINDAAANNSSSPTFGVRDGVVTPTDFVAFTIYFSAGCPCDLPGCPEVEGE